MLMSLENAQIMGTFQQINLSEDGLFEPLGENEQATADQPDLYELAIALLSRKDQ